MRLPRENAKERCYGKSYRASEVSGKPSFVENDEVEKARRVEIYREQVATTGRIAFLPRKAGAIADVFSLLPS